MSGLTPAPAFSLMSNKLFGFSVSQPLLRCLTEQSTQTTARAVLDMGVSTVDIGQADHNFSVNIEEKSLRGPDKIIGAPGTLARK